MNITKNEIISIKEGIQFLLLDIKHFLKELPVPKTATELNTYTLIRDVWISKYHSQELRLEFWESFSNTN